MTVDDNKMKALICLTITGLIAVSYFRDNRIATIIAGLIALGSIIAFVYRYRKYYSHLRS